MTITDWIGAIGVGLILFAYLLTIYKVIDQSKDVYMILNIVGGSMACYASILINYVPFIILEGTWTMVSVIVFLKHRMKTTDMPVFKKR